MRERECDGDPCVAIGRTRTVAAERLVSLRRQKGDGKPKDEGLRFRRAPKGSRMTVTDPAADTMGRKSAEPPKI